MAKTRQDDLAYWRDEAIIIQNREELELLMTGSFAPGASA